MPPTPFSGGLFSASGDDSGESKSNTSLTLLFLAGVCLKFLLHLSTFELTLCRTICWPLGPASLEGVGTLGAVRGAWVDQLGPFTADGTFLLAAMAVVQCFSVLWMM